MYYVYRIQSLTNPSQFYTGLTTDISNRIKAHNNGQSYHTAKYRPWKLITFFAFENREKAIKFEKYLKTGSGRAFTKRHF